jgi:uncharacterized membrane protein
MSDYTPDKWVVVKITGPVAYPVHKVFACWYGGYLGSDSWKLNSGITRAYEEGHCFMFDGSSGSTYACHKAQYGTNGYGQGVLVNMIANAGMNGVKIEVLPEQTNWLEINYE